MLDKPQIVAKEWRFWSNSDVHIAGTMDSDAQPDEDDINEVDETDELYLIRDFILPALK